MATDSVALCNSALIKLGSETITSLSDNTRRAKLCNDQYDKLRKQLLMSHPWNFAIKRQYLTKVTDTANAVNSGTDTFTTAASMNMVTGDRITFDLDSGTIPSPLSENQVYYAIKLTSTTFQVATTQAYALAGTALDITDAPVFSATVYVGPPFEYDNKYSLPSDYLRSVREEYKDADWKREGDYIVTSEDAFNLLYIADISDTTKFSPQFDELLSLLIAKEVAYPLVQSNSLVQVMEQRYQVALRDARSFDAQEGSPEIYEANDWENARR